MNPFDKRGSVAVFFGKARERSKIIKCEANHFRARDCGEQSALRKASAFFRKAEACCFNKIVGDALHSDRIEDINLCNEWKNKGIDIVLCTMIRRRGMKMSEVCKNWETIDLNELTNIVAHRGCLEMLSMCREKQWINVECINYTFVMEYAALCGFLDIVKMCKERGAKKFDNVITFAAESGHIEIVELCKKWGARNTRAAMHRAARSGYIEIVKLCREWGAKNFGEVMCHAASKGHIEIAKLCKEWGAKDFDEAMYYAAKNGRIEIVKLCKKWGARNFDEVMRYATIYEHIEIIKLCKKWGGKNFDAVNVLGGWIWVY